MDQEKINKQIFARLDNYENRIKSIEAGLPTSKKDENKPKITENDSASNLILAIINKIGECDESDKIQANILDQNKLEGKILLCYYISYKYFKNAWLTTGDVEKITSGLGIKIAIGNISNKITDELRKYLEGETTRKHGAPTPYRLNRKGSQRLEEIIRGDKK